jgi:hypothetical protein
MSSSPPLNPYEPPSEAAQLYSPSYQAGNIEHFKLLKQFRQQIHALGGFWIFIGSTTAAVCILLVVTNGDALGLRTGGVAVMIITGVAAVIWFGIGIAACLKQMWAVYVGLGLSYLSVLGNLINLNVCSLVILAVVIIQAHRVIGFASRLRGLNIPLTIRPEQLTMQVAPPTGQWPT